MNLSRLSLIFAGAGWAFGLLIFGLIQAVVASGQPNPLLDYTSLLCGCILPAIWIVGAMLGGNHALSFARNNERVPRAGVAGLLLNLLGLAATLIYMLLTLLA